MQIDNKQSFIPEEPRIAIVTVISSQIAGHKNASETEHSLAELKQLLETLKLTVECEYIQALKHIDPAHVVGEGKIEEIAAEAELKGFNLLVFDIELSSSQHRNIQEKTGLVVIDRNMVILEIFAKHARSKDAKMQVEIAKLEYLLPRLHSLHFRQERGKGGSPGMRSGQGETAKEMERRMIKDRIAFYKKESESIEQNLEQQRKKREENTYIAALVGYTNAGKSSMMNRLCREEVLEEDKLFATVDATYRSMAVSFKPPIVLIDTVGFISNLPTQLVKGFRTTLASVLEAHFLIIVADIADPNCHQQLKVTLEVLDELKALERPRIILFNKKDRMSENPNAQAILEEHPEHILVCSFDEVDIETVKNSLVQSFHKMQKEFQLFIPYSDGQAHSKVMECGNIISSESLDEGIRYTVFFDRRFEQLDVVRKYKVHLP